MRVLTSAGFAPLILALLVFAQTAVHNAQAQTVVCDGNFPDEYCDCAGDCGGTYCQCSEALAGTCCVSFVAIFFPEF